MEATSDERAIAEAFASIRSPTQRCLELAGRVVDGGFTLEGMLPHGQGGMGVVYRATHKQMKPVAVKVFAFDVDENKDGYERFLKEVHFFQKCAGVANMVDIHGAGTIDGMPFYAMRLIGGESLDQWLCRRPSKRASAAEVLSILNQLLNFLDDIQRKRAASRLDFVHRDIKPANVMISGDREKETVTLVDFGSGQFFAPHKAITNSDASHATNSSIFDGRTPGWESPEMLLSSHKEHKGRSRSLCSSCPRG